MTLFAFLALALAICTVGWHFGGATANARSDDRSTHHNLQGTPLPVVSLLLAAFTLSLALLAGLITILAAGVCSLTAALAVWLRMPATSQGLQGAGWVILALLALAAALHLLPGFQNPLLLQAQQLTPDAIPYTLYANFDKGWAGYCLLLAIWPLQRIDPVCASKSHTSILSHRLHFYWKGFWPVWPLTIILALGLAMSLQLIQFAPKWPDFALQFIFCNLLLTCVAEEAFFRGLLQRPLLNHLQRRGWSIHTAAWCAILAISLLFGLAHLAGGWAYALVATVASIGYGWAYQRSGRIEVAILAHFGLNLLHLTLFTYPMLR